MMNRDILTELLEQLTELRKQIQSEITEQMEISHESFKAGRALIELRELHNNITNATKRLKKLLEMEAEKFEN